MAEDPGALRVPKQRLAVELSFGGRTARRVEIFLAEHRAHAWRRQDVLDLLEHESSFLPAHDVADDAWCVFNKETVRWVALPLAAGEADDDEDEELFDHRRRVTIVTTDGESLDGELLWSSPADKGRVVDLLNQPGRFLRVFAADHLYLVNKAFVVRVVDKGE